MAREMKDSEIPWIGKIPKDWSVRPIKSSFLVVSGATPKSNNPEYWDGDVVWVTPADYKFEDKYVSSGKRNLTQAGYDSCGTTLVPAGSIIFSKRAPIGTVAISNCTLCTNQGCLSCVPKPGTSTRFFYYTMAAFPEQFNLYGAGTTFKEISSTSFSNFKLPLPPYSEQEHIADFLDAKCERIDGITEKTRASIAEYKKLKLSMITEAVTRGIRPNRKMKPSGIEWIGEIPEEWNREKVVRLFQTIGSGTTPKSDNDNYYGGNIHWIQSGDINGGFLADTKTSINEEAIKRFTALKVYKAPFIIMAMYGASIGNLSVSQIDACVNQACCVMKNGIQDIRYSFYALKTAKEYLIWKAVGGGQPNISQETIRQLWLPMPPVSEQQEIADYLDEKSAAIDALIDQKTRLITELAAYKKSLIYEYVTGKKEVA